MYNSVNLDSEGLLVSSQNSGVLVRSSNLIEQTTRKCKFVYWFGTNF